ncbi:hypothetical protein [Actinoplanes subglobosus]|uniref:Uncharacterized protein n=1 Tax=Actinoplanes subglobosus TaxID=1547892 RepID=A0ABV8ISM3_9ACTN
MFRNFCSNGGTLDVTLVNDLLKSPAITVERVMATYWSLGPAAGTLPPRAPSRSAGNSVLWDHLIYAYMIENTRIYEIVKRILSEIRHGERLGIPQKPATYQWLETTEELFYKDASPFLFASQVSRIRPEIQTTRCIDYTLMFGMGLNHGRDDGPYPFVKPDAANHAFVPTLEEFLRLVWIGIENNANTTGAKPTDDAGIADLARRLHDMLVTRRGPLRLKLAREEFDHVATMSWLHLTLLTTDSILDDLQIVASSPEERLRAMGDRVGLPAHSHSHSYFILAPAMSELLWLIESGVINSNNVPLLFGGGLGSLLKVIITHWSRVTGRDLKAPSMALTQRSGMPAVTVPGGLNGRAPQPSTAV